MLRSGCTLLALAALPMLPVALQAKEAAAQSAVPVGMVAIAPKSSDAVAGHTRRLQETPRLTHRQKLSLLRKRIRYVFVLFQENRSFDFYFGTYPGARGLFSQSAANTPGFVQPIVLTNGSVGSISPFLIPQSITAYNGTTVLLYPEDTYSVGHGHAAIPAPITLLPWDGALAGSPGTTWLRQPG